MARTAPTATATARAAAAYTRPGWLRRDHETLSAYLFLAPNAIGFLLFSALPVLAALVLAFYDWDLLLGADFVGLENFRQLLFEDANFHAAFLNTFYFVVVSVPLSAGLGLAVALLCNQALRGITLYRSIFLLPYVTITVAVALVWRWLYHPDLGLINRLLALVGIDGPAWLVSTRWAMPAIIFLSVWKSFGYNMVLFLAGLQSIPEQLYEAATIDGANAWQRFRHITLPMLSPTTFFVVIISIIGSFQVFDQALVMTGGGPGVATTTLVLFIYQVGFQAFHMGYAAAAAWLLFVVVMVFTVIQFRAQRRWVTYE
jgi:multiple sugar transport system permease protein